MVALKLAKRSITHSAHHTSRLPADIWRDLVSPGLILFRVRHRTYSLEQAGHWISPLDVGAVVLKHQPDRYEEHEPLR
jgi:hypothetical protein